MLTSYVHRGMIDEVALIISGIHGSELSGIEVANWVRVNLKQSSAPPLYTTVIIPEIFPDQARLARNSRIQKNFANESIDSDVGRDVYFRNRPIGTNRQFPRPGDPLRSLKDSTVGGQPLLPEIRDLFQVIALTKPVRIASLHAHTVPGRTARKGRDWPGIFVDPRYTFDKGCLRSFPVGPYNVNACKFELGRDPSFSDPGKKRFPSALSDDGKEDDQLALRIAKEIKSHRPDLVPGNHLDDAIAPVVHYAAHPPPGFPGFSIGDWAPVNVGKEGETDYRKGAPVITVEVVHYYESWAFINGEQFYDERGGVVPGKAAPLIPGRKKPFPFNRARAAELQIYAKALLTEFLQVKT